jgi:hypothetical protein
MTDREFLLWLYDRLEHVYHEPQDADYMHTLRAIIEAMPEAHITTSKEGPHV